MDNDYVLYFIGLDEVLSLSLDSGETLSDRLAAMARAKVLRHYPLEAALQSVHVEGDTLVVRIGW